MGVKKFKEGMLDFLYVLNDNPSNSDILNKIEELNKKWKDFDIDGYEANCKKMKISLNRAKEGKYTGEGNITYKGEKGKEGFTKVQIIEDTVEDKKDKNNNKDNETNDKKDNQNEEKKEEDKNEEEKKEENKEENKKGGFKKIQIIEED